jgi:hypothetical protein
MEWWNGGMMEWWNDGITPKSSKAKYREFQMSKVKG